MIRPPKSRERLDSRSLDTPWEASVHATPGASTLDLSRGTRRARPLQPMTRLPARSRPRLSRRTLLGAAASAGVGASAIALVGCGDDDDADSADQTPEDPTDQTPDTGMPIDEVPENVAPVLLPQNPVSGGVIAWPTQIAMNNHDRWDPHRTRFTETQMWLSTMYNRLVRWDSISGGSLEADLASSLPETPDETTYIFSVNPAARFWDQEPMNGRAVTAEDVRFTIQRQIDALDSNANPDPFFFRQDDYARTASLDITDELTISLTTEEPDATYLTNVHAGPWAWIIGAESPEYFGNDWRDAPDNHTLNAGTGPFLPAGFDVDTAFHVRRSENWWKPDLPIYPEGWSFLHVDADSAESSYRNGTIDSIDFPLGKSSIDDLRTDFPHHTAYERPIQTAIQLGMVFDAVAGEGDNPFADIRLARAMHLAIDRFELIDALYFGDGRLSGPIPWFFDEWAMPEDDLLQVPGYRPDKTDDLEEISALVSAAGGADLIGRIPIVIPDLFQGVFPGIADTIQTMFQRNLGLSIDIDFLPYDGLFAGIQDKTVPGFIGLGPVSLQQPEADPTTHWLNTAHSSGDANWGGYSNANVDELLGEMRTTFDEGERRNLALQVQQHLLDDPFWLVNITNGIQLGISRPYLFTDDRALDFAWSAHHFEKSWIDSSNPEYPEERMLPPLDMPIDPTTTDGTPVEEGANPESGAPDAGTGGELPPDSEGG